MSALLANRVGVVLGASRARSVGREAVAHLRSLGASVAFSYRTRTAENAEDALGIPIDFDDEGSIEAGMAELAQRFGRLDFLVHTLVSVPPGALGRPLLALTKDEFNYAMQGGAYSLVRALRYALPLLERSSAPRVVALLSAGAEFAIPNYHAVGIAKAALAASLRYAAQELGPEGVLCNGVSFSIIDTEAADHNIGQDITRRSRDYLAKHAMTRRAVSYGDVTGAIAYLCSQICQNMTGEIINVDGGYTRSYF